MRGFLINKNICLYYWLRKRIGKKAAFCIAGALEAGILVFGRETWNGSRQAGKEPRDAQEISRPVSYTS